MKGRAKTLSPFLSPILSLLCSPLLTKRPLALVLVALLTILHARCGYHGWFPTAEHLIERHHPSLGPRSGKGLLAELGAGGSHRTFIVSTIDRRHGCSHRFTQRACRTPEPHGPDRFSLGHE